jgi:hypothetical protein
MMAAMAQTLLETIHMDQTEAESLFEKTAQRYLHMTTAQFLAAWDEHRFGPNPDAVPGVMRVAALLPLVR